MIQCDAESVGATAYSRGFEHEVSPSLVPPILHVPVSAHERRSAITRPWPQSRLLPGWRQDESEITYTLLMKRSVTRCTAVRSYISHLAIMSLIWKRYEQV